MQNTRVVMVLESIFPTPGGGGAESQVRTLGLHLPRHGVAVSVIVPMVRNGPQIEHDRVDGIEVWRIAYPKLRSVGAAIMLVKLAWRLFGLRGEYDFIHAHIAGNMAAVCCVMGWLLGKPVLVKLTGMTEMVGGIIDPQAGFAARLKRRLMRGATFYQATSSQIARMLTEAGFDGAKVHRIPNAVDTSRFAALARNAQERLAVCGQRRLVGIFVGRLEAEKDLHLMLRGWAGAFKGQSDVALVLVGSGSLLEPLRALAAELGIAGQVIFAGPTKSVERFLAIADVGLLTSRAEGLSNTLLEYMASGLPVIGSRVSGTEDFVVDGRTGWLFPAGDEPQFREALRRAAQLLPEELRQLGENARELVTVDASNAAVIARLLALYGSGGRAR